MTPAAITSQSRYSGDGRKAAIRPRNAARISSGVRSRRVGAAAWRTPSAPTPTCGSAPSRTRAALAFLDVAVAGDTAGTVTAVEHLGHVWGSPASASLTRNTDRHAGQGTEIGMGASAPDCQRIDVEECNGYVT